jgi:hypothetical protein
VRPAQIQRNLPLAQLWRQEANLTHARSITTRTFTADEQASNHCQVGNIGAAVRVIEGWLDQLNTSVAQADIDGGFAQAGNKADR